MAGLKREDLLKCASIYIDEIYNESYPGLVSARDFVLNELRKEIERFEGTLENGMKEFKKILSGKDGSSKVIPGKEAFYLYDTFGFPLELTVELAQEEGYTVDNAGFDAAMEEQKNQARRSKSFSQKDTASIYDGLDESVTTEFTGYTSLEENDVIKAIAADEGLVESADAGDSCVIITARTPFYATMGGQKGDKGVIKSGSAVFEVEETVKVPGGRIGHVGKVVSGKFSVNDKVTLSVDKDTRSATCKNHSATHLLQAALRQVAGNDVHQQGSYQDDLRTRFDFSYGCALTPEQIKEVERIVNEKIAEGLAVNTDVMGIDEAKSSGAMALFGEKYGSTVRVVSMGSFSKELCGGTHVTNTADIGLFKIMSESGIAAGVRRIEAITGAHVLEFFNKQEEVLEKAAAAAKTDIASLPAKIASMQEEIKTLLSENEKLKAKVDSAKLGDMTNNIVDVKGVKLLSASVKDVDMNGLRGLGDKLRSQIGEGVVFLASAHEGKACLLAMATDAAIARGAHAGNLIKEVAVLVGGGGGGRPNMAQAGGKNPAAIEKAVAAVYDVVSSQIKD